MIYQVPQNGDYVTRLSTEQSWCDSQQDQNIFSSPVSETALGSIRQYIKQVKSKVYFITGHEGPEGEQTYSSTLSLTSALDGVVGKRHVLAALALGKRPGTHCIAGWVVPRAGLDRWGKSCTHRDLIPGPPRP